MSKTLLYDFNNLAIRHLFSGEIGATTEHPIYELWMYQIFNSIYEGVSKFRDVNEVVLAMDSKDSWRKMVFPRYKESRKKKRKDDVDWDTVFKNLKFLATGIRDNIPFKILKVQHCEADDIIGILCRNIENKNFHIVSTDSDYKQLCDCAVIYDPRKKENMVCENVEEFIVRSSLMGQAKDDIFNVKTPLDWGQTPETEGKRKPGLGPKTADKIMDQGWKTWLEKEGLQERFDLNRQLIDFKKIPELLVTKVTERYNNYVLPPPDRAYGFFKKMEWRGFIEDFDKIEPNLMRLY